jgi:hypothetical protein
VPTPRSRVANSLLQYFILRTFITMVEMREKGALLRLAESLKFVNMSTDCSFSGDSSGNPACANWWITPGLKKNLLSISTLDEKGFIVAFVDGEVLMWPRGKFIDDAIVIGVQGGLYKLKGHSDSTLVHNIVNTSELWHRRLAHIHYKALSIVSKMIAGLLEIQVNHDGICKGCAQGKNMKSQFPRRIAKPKVFWTSCSQTCVDR